MHDLDRTLNEFSAGEFAGEYGELTGEFAGEFSGEFGEYGEFSGEFGEMNEQEEEMLAAELLGVSNEQELEQFLGSLFSKAVGAARSIAASPAGKALGGILKSAAGKALPTLGGAIGGYFAGPAGQKFGQQAGSFVKGQLGWEMEGSYEMELETAKGLVRTATTAARTLAARPTGAPPAAAAKQAAIQAAQQHAPQLVRAIAAARPGPAGGVGIVVSGGGGSVGGQRGCWVRRGNTIVLLNV